MLAKMFPWSRWSRLFWRSRRLCDRPPRRAQGLFYLANRGTRWGLRAGCIGSVLVCVGSLGAGSTPIHDRLLEQAHLSWLRFGHGLVVSSALLWIGVGTMIVAWVNLWPGVLTKTIDHSQLVWGALSWCAPLLLSVPVFSRDAYSYLAQGALLRDGFDPYHAGPVFNPGFLLDNVSPIWAATTSPYGPLFILIARAITTMSGQNIITGTILLRLTMFPGFVLLTWSVPAIARRVGGHPRLSLYLTILNPLVIIHLIGGVHNELLMVGLMSAGIALMVNHHPYCGIVLLTLAIAVKATAIIVVPFMVWIWVHQRRDHNPHRRWWDFCYALGATIAMVIGVFGLLSALAGVNLGWLTALLSGNVKIINWLTIPTATANLIHGIASLIHPINFWAVVHITRIIGVLIIGITLPILWWVFRVTDRSVLIGMSVAMFVVVLFVPATLPWYYTWPLVIGATIVDTPRWISGLSTWIMMIFRPDGAHGMYSWGQVLIASAAAGWVWYMLSYPAYQSRLGQSYSPVTHSSLSACPSESSYPTAEYPGTI